MRAAMLATLLLVILGVVGAILIASMVARAFEGVKMP